eukprot:357906-Chlamydomonas_euryale.AAC.2
MDTNPHEQQRHHAPALHHVNPPWGAWTPALPRSRPKITSTHLQPHENQHPVAAACKVQRAQRHAGRLDRRPHAVRDNAVDVQRGQGQRAGAAVGGEEARGGRGWGLLRGCVCGGGVVERFHEAGSSTGALRLRRQDDDEVRRDDETTTWVKPR